MRPSDAARLVALAAIWGASFIFMRVAAPQFGAVLTADLRMLIAGAALAGWFAATGVDIEWRRYWRQYALLGCVSSAVPFGLFAFAALHIPAPLSAVLNAAAPMFGALAGALWLGERLSVRRCVGLASGAAGVALVSRPEGFGDSPLFVWAVLACLGATVCYGVIGVLIRRFAPKASARGMAAGSQLGAGLLCLLLVPLALPPAAPSAVATLNLLALGLLCTAVAYLLYFRLIVDLGATRALTVTYLIPMFGLLWGWLFLGERLPPTALAGGALIVAGTVLVTRG